MACKTCQVRKIKCDRTRPACNNCLQRSVPCAYTSERNKRRKLNDHVAPFGGTYRFVEHNAGGGRKNEKSRPRTTIQPDEPAVQTSKEPANENVTGGSEVAIARAEESVIQSQPPTSDNISSTALSDPFDEFDSLQLDQSHINEAPNVSHLVEKILDGYESDCLLNRNPAVWIYGENGGEYTGQSSGISILSDLNLRWLQNNVQGAEALQSTLKGVRSEVLSHLRRPKCIITDMWPTPERLNNLKPLPSLQEIERYVDSYFSDVQVLYPILDRATFEARLAQYDHDQTDCTDSWRALLYAVIASGCRAALSDETTEAFQKSGREAWGYFCNALSYETKLVHGPTDLTAVQALVVMAVFAQGMSSPQRLEYTLCSTASRLAYGLALNLCPPTEWNMSESEMRERNRTFWVIYCLDKTIAIRTGRPPSIHDDQITCLFPRHVSFAQNSYSSSTRTGQSPGENMHEFDFFLILTKYSRLCSRISHGLYSATALCRPPIDLLATANSVLSGLEAWRQSIPAHVRPGQSFNRLPAMNYAARQRILALHFSYSYAICSVHRRFTRLFTDHDNTQVEDVGASLMSKPMNQIEAARSMVLLMKHLDIESYSPGWLVFYYPMTAITTIFMHVVCNPLASSTSSDIALMDAVVGFFGRVEFVTSGEAAFTQMGEFVQQARHIVAKSREGAAQRQESSHILSSDSDRNLASSYPRPTLSMSNQVINQFETHLQYSATRGIEEHNTVAEQDTVRRESGRSNIETPSREPETSRLVQPTVEGPASNPAENLSPADVSTSVEQLEQILATDLTQPLLGLIPGALPTANWLDAWMSPRHAEGLVFDGSLQSWT